MAELVQIRCSRLPEAFKCGQSLRGEMEISPYNEASELGTAAHRLLATRSSSQEAIDAEAARIGADAGELGMLVRNGEAMRADLGIRDGAVTEVALVSELGDDLELSGHLDVLDDSLVVDWKTGRVDKSHRAQLLGYAILALDDDPAMPSVTTKIAWLREREVEAYHWGREQLPEMIAEIRDATSSTDYRPGAHCTHCPRNHNCPALSAIAKRDIAAFADQATVETIKSGLRDLVPSKLVELFRKSKQVKAFCESLDHHVRQLVLERGPLDTGDGSELRFVEENRRDVDTLLAWPVLSAALDDVQIAGVVDISLSRAEKLIADKARESGAPIGKSVKAFSASLEAAGAISTKTIKKLVERRK